MIKFITITNYKNESLTIDIFNPKTSGFNIRNITGLGPVKADITTTKMVVADGDVYNSARANGRNIVLTLGPEMVPELGLNSVEDCRQRSYRYFPLKKKLKFSITTDNRELYTYGYVESNEPDIFSDDETFQISIICPSSYFLSEHDKMDKISNVKGLFKFPFEVLIEDEPVKDLIERGKDYSLEIVDESCQDIQFYGNDAYNLYSNRAIYGDFMLARYGLLTGMTYDQVKIYSKGE